MKVLLHATSLSVRFSFHPKSTIARWASNITVCASLVMRHNSVTSRHILAGRPKRNGCNFTIRNCRPMLCVCWKLYPPIQNDNDLLGCYIRQIMNVFHLFFIRTIVQIMFIRWKMKCSIQLGSASLNGTLTKLPCHRKLCAFRCLISKPQVLNLRSWNQVQGN